MDIPEKEIESENKKTTLESLTKKRKG